MNKVKQLTWVCLSDKLERTYLKTCCKLSNNIFCLFFTESFFKKLFSISNTTFCNILLCKTHFIELI